MKQLTVIADDRPGLLADITYILGTAHMNIEAIDVHVHGGKGIIHLTVKDAEKASKMLKANGYEPFEVDVKFIRVLDKPGALAEVSKILADGKVNVEMLRQVCVDGGYAINTLKTDNPAKTAKLLEKYLKLD